MKKSVPIYTIIIGVFLFLILGILQLGQTLYGNAKAVSTLKTDLSFENFATQFAINFHHPFSLLMLQIIIILAISKLFGLLISKIGQPSVVGEIIAGITLGPSILGYFNPELLAFIFPKNSIHYLSFLSQIGLTFFMFLVGMELDISKIKNKAKEAFIISHSSIIIPFFFGVLLSYFIYEQFAPKDTNFIIFSLFMGIAMSITAFPVLARIVRERKLSDTPLGIMAISCAAADDVTAWCILAVVVSLAKAGSILTALYTIVPAILFVMAMFWVVRPWLKKLFIRYNTQNELNKTLVSIIFLTLLLSSFLAEVIGIHFLFGAFLAGLIMPEGVRVKELLSEKVEDISLIVFLPIFFAVTGLRTEITLLKDGNLWPICLLVIFVAILGKFVGSAAAAKLTGQSWKDSLSIGALMNTRGLMELVVLNIGYDLGIISADMFAIMVLMALFTTFMTAPALDFINFLFKKSNPNKIML